MPKLTTLELCSCRFDAPGTLLLLLYSLRGLKSAYILSPVFIDEQNCAAPVGSFRWMNTRSPVNVTKPLSLKQLCLGFGRRNICRHDLDIFVRPDAVAVDVLETLTASLDIGSLTTLWIDLSSKRGTAIISHMIGQRQWHSVKTISIMDHCEKHSLPLYLTAGVRGELVYPPVSRFHAELNITTAPISGLVNLANLTGVRRCFVRMVSPDSLELIVATIKTLQSAALEMLDIRIAFRTPWKFISISEWKPLYDVLEYLYSTGNQPYISMGGSPVFILRQGCCYPEGHYVKYYHSS